MQRVLGMGLGLAIIALTGWDATYGQTPDDFNPRANNSVLTLAVQADGKILVGGLFTTLVGQPRERIGRLNRDGTLDEDFNPGANKEVNYLAVQADGKILVLGDYTELAGQPRNHIARLNSNGTLDASFNPEPDSYVYAVAVQADGKIMAGGNFTTVGGEPRNHIARLNSDGTLDTSFNLEVDGSVYCMGVQTDGRIVVGGCFTRIDGQTRGYVARLNSDGTLDTTFNPGARGCVSFLAIQGDGKIVVSGDATDGGWETRSFIRRINSNGTLDAPFHPDGSGHVSSLAVQTDGKILVGGDFTALGGQSCSRLARLNGDGTLDTTFSPGVTNDVWALTVQGDGKILLGESFGIMGRLNNTEPATESLSFDGSSITWLRGGTGPEVSYTRFDSSTNHGIDWSTAGAGTRISGGWQTPGISVSPGANIRARGYLTGETTWFVESVIGPLVIVSQPASRTNNAGTTAIFEVFSEGTQPISYHWLKEGEALSDTAKVSGSTTPRLMLSHVLHGDEGRYAAVISNALGSVTSVVAELTVLEPFIASHPMSQNANPGDNVEFSVKAAGTKPLGYQWSKDGMNLAGATAFSLLLTNVQRADAGSYNVVASNQFGAVTSVAAVLTVNLAIPDAFNPGASGLPGRSAVQCMAVQADGRILAGGSFTMLGGQTRKYIGRLNNDGLLDASFNPEVDGPVYCLGIQADGKVLAGGSFITPETQTRQYIKRLHVDGTSDAEFNPDVDGLVFTLVEQPDGKILAGGEFTTVCGQRRNFIARLNASGTLDQLFNPGGNGITWGGSVQSIALQPDGKILAGGEFTTMCGEPRQFIARLNSDGTLDQSFNPGANGYVTALAVQADGKILVSGWFSLLGGEARSHLGRLNGDGTVDNTFDPGANSPVVSLVMQTDGKILASGAFTILGGQSRSGIGRLNGDGTIDTTFNPGAGDRSGNHAVYCLALQADGRILAGGSFTLLGGQPRNYIGRLNNTDPATESFFFGGSGITWLRGGTSPEVWRTSFDVSTNNGMNWVRLGAGARTSGGWCLDSPSVAGGASVRARGHLTGGVRNGSAWFVESSIVTQPPQIAAQPAGLKTNAGATVEFHVVGEGTPLLTYQWLKDGTSIPGATAPSLTLANIQESDQADYAARVSNAFGSVTSSPAPLVVNQPPVADATATRSMVVSGNGVDGKVILDGTRSSDPDGDLLWCTWYEIGDAVPLTNGIAAVAVLPVGTHSLLLVVNDGMLTNETGTTMEVVTTTEAVRRLRAAVMCQVSHPQPLVATLSAVLASIARGSSVCAINELIAFQNKVRALVKPRHPDLAAAYLRAAQEIIDALKSQGRHPGERNHGHFTSIRHSRAGATMGFSADAGSICIIEASTNLVYWEMIGVATQEQDEEITFSDPNAARFPCRYYRIRQVVP